MSSAVIVAFSMWGEFARKDKVYNTKLDLDYSVFSPVTL
jgi:hypothetical protein